MQLSIHIMTDAATRRAIALRRGLGKVRHIETHELWIQGAVEKKRTTIHKTNNKYNPADMLAKNLTRDEMGPIIDRIGHAYEEGRSDAAAELNFIDVVPMMLHLLGKHKYNNCSV